jgi:uncharacterized low-complexity protein
MKTSKLGLLAASAVASVLGSAALAQGAAAEDAKACFRTHCGKSVAGYEGKCGGTPVPELKDETACEVAGGDWTAPANARKYEKEESR